MLKDWVFPIVDIVKDHPVDTAEGNGKKVMVGIIIICIIGKLLETKLLSTDNIPLSYAASMLQTLCLNPDLVHKKCLDYEFVRRFIPDHYVKDVTSAISELGNYLMVKADIEHAEWLYCLPILHFLNNHIKPFDTLDFPVDNIDFPDPCLKLGRISDKVAAKEGYATPSPSGPFLHYCYFNPFFSFFVRYFEKLRPLLYTDPILQTTFTYICPRKDRSLFIYNVSPYLCIALMIQRLRTNNKAEQGYWVSSISLWQVLLFYSFSHLVLCCNILKTLQYP